jgi:DNA-directed RNA polymerase subunit alpha
VTADRNFDEDLGIGWIPIDSVHSPVKKVNYVIESARLGQVTDYEKLTLDVWTNGAISPRDAVSLSARLVRDHLAIFVSVEDSTDLSDEAQAAQGGIIVSNEHLDKIVGAIVQLPEEREYPDHSRTRAEKRTRDAQDEEFRPEVAQRD